jgi:zinc/manganese transport system permease protein
MTSRETITGTMLEYEFMRNAFGAAGVVAVVAGCCGYFLVLRGQSFAGHALAHVGFTGATGAVLIGVAPLWGLVVVTVGGGIAMGALGERFEGRDVAIGIVLALSLGLGLLFLHFFTSNAAQATALLFGNLLGVDKATLAALGVLALLCLAALALISRPVLFASLQPELAEAKGVSLRATGILFLAVVAVAIAESAQIVGVLLVFALMVAPAATAQRLARSVRVGVLLSVVIALIAAWGGLTLAFYTDWPTSFWITALASVLYGIANRTAPAGRA